MPTNYIHDIRPFFRN